MAAEIEYEPHPDGGMIETDESFDRRMSERCKPDPAKPWRITWGFGCFSDHASKGIAERAAKRIPRNLNPSEPFDTRKGS